MVTVAEERASRREKLAGTARTTKGKRSGKIPIHPRLRELLTNLPHAADGQVFHSERGACLRPNNVLHVFIRDVIKPIAEGKEVPLKADAGDPASRVEPCPVSAEQAKAVPDMPERVTQLLAAPAGTTAYELFCPNKG